MAVLPTPGSPISTGLFLVRRQDLDDPLDLGRLQLRPITGNSSSFVVAVQVAVGDASLLARRRQKQVLGSDVLVAHVPGLLGRVLEDLFSPLGRRDIAQDQPPLAHRQGPLDLQLHFPDVHLRFLQGLDGHPFSVLEEGEHYVFRQELFGMKTLCFFLG
jgi:hypothetical protein